ncbi:hypothetical protein ACO0LM_24110 [Undibacterium sp. Di26W]|uniref:hypothetical protein n=1 Tax=Undibacterium sp. Di26W TaxID=3413035 RepID=UPI003BF3FCD8
MGLGQLTINDFTRETHPHPNLPLEGEGAPGYNKIAVQMTDAYIAPVILPKLKKKVCPKN